MRGRKDGAAAQEGLERENENWKQNMLLGFKRERKKYW